MKPSAPPHPPGEFEANSTGTIELELGTDAATLACVGALEAQCWEVLHRHNGTISAFEDPTMLHMMAAASRLEMKIEPCSHDRTRVTIAVAAPGGGDHATQRAAKQAFALFKRIEQLAG
jgi:hypothetical protein